MQKTTTAARRPKAPQNTARVNDSSLPARILPFRVCASPVGNVAYPSPRDARVNELACFVQHAWEQKVAPLPQVRQVLIDYLANDGRHTRSDGGRRRAAVAQTVHAMLPVFLDGGDA